ncbi:unnamed protein product [Closterium sp. Yama58-4]|nr:unnamed protein product [Closterium sp. Yama58-4]
MLRQMNLPEAYLLSRAAELLNHEWTPDPPGVNPLTTLEAMLPIAARAALHTYREQPAGKGNLQLTLSRHINETRAAELLADTIEDRPGKDCGHAVRLISLQGVGAGDWLHAIPTRSDLTFAPGQFSLALGFRLGMALPVTVNCPCKRDNTAITDTSLANHLLRCGYGGDVVRTHNALVYALLRMAKEADFTVFHETTAFSPPVIRKSDLAIRDKESNETWVTNVTVTDLVLQCRNKRARKPPGWAAREASERKHRIYEGRPDYVGFFGLAVETYGALATDTQQFIRLLASSMAKRRFRQGRLTTTTARLTAHYRQRFSVMLQRSQATSFLNKSNIGDVAAFSQTARDPWEPSLGDLWQVLEDEMEGVLGQ